MTAQPTTIKFTGKRSGHEAVMIPGRGTFERGDTLELPTKGEADDWTRADDLGSDWEIVEEKKAAAAAKEND